MDNPYAFDGQDSNWRTEIDLATATPADLRFSADFKLKATRQVRPPRPPQR